MTILNKDVSPSALVEIIDMETYKKPNLTGVRTNSGYVFFDNSTLESARTCMRYFYFKHIRKFNPIAIKPPLVFGSSWHSAMDFFWPSASEGMKKELVLEGSFNHFMNVWNESGISKVLDDMDLYPRTPTKALEVLEYYYKLYGDDMQRYQVLSVERPFIIPLTSDNQKLMYIGKIDKEIQDIHSEDILGVDHKTASVLGILWEAGFSPNSQFDGYFHAERMHYGQKFRYFIVDGIQIHKTKLDHRRLFLHPQVSEIESWLWETLEKIAEIQYNEELLMEYRDSEKHLNFLPAFPKNCKMCSNQYGKPCIYRDLCNYQNNPEDYEINEDQFDTNLWQPFQITEKPTKDGMTFDVVSNEGE